MLPEVRRPVGTGPVSDPPNLGPADARSCSRRHGCITNGTGTARVGHASSDPRRGAPVPPRTHGRGTMERAGQDLLADVLASLPSHTAVLGPDGLRRRRQRRLAALLRRERRRGRSGAVPGPSYLAVCEADPARHPGGGAGGGRRRAPRAERRGRRASPLTTSAPRRRRSAGSRSPSSRCAARPARTGRPRGAVVSHSDITARKLGEVALLHEATHDPLTGLLNRSLLLAELRRELHRAQADGSELSVLYLDLDGFKAVNDSLGHGAGDDLLRTTAARLRTTLRPGDHLARMGGDEFVAVLPRTGRRGGPAARAPPGRGRAPPGRARRDARHRHREHRHRRRPRGAAATPEDAARGGRLRHVPGQAAGPGPHRGLRRRPAGPGRAADRGRGPARRGAGPRGAPAVPAAGGPPRPTAPGSAGRRCCAGSPPTAGSAPPTASSTSRLTPPWPGPSPARSSPPRRRRRAADGAGRSR